MPDTYDRTPSIHKLRLLYRDVYDAPEKASDLRRLDNFLTDCDIVETWKGMRATGIPMAQIERELVQHVIDATGEEDGQFALLVTNAARQFAVYGYDEEGL